MKRFLLWSFERGSFQYDVICGLILAFIFLTPSFAFHDRPDFMKFSSRDPDVRVSHEDNGAPVYTVRVQTPLFSAESERRAAVRAALEHTLGSAVTVSRMQPIYGMTGSLVAYAIWIER